MNERVTIFKLVNFCEQNGGAIVVKIKVLFLESDREFQVQDGDGSRPPVAAAARRMYA